MRTEWGWVLLALLVLAASGCVGYRTDGLACLSDRDCVGGERCDRIRAICQPVDGIDGAVALDATRRDAAAYDAQPAPTPDAGPGDLGPISQRAGGCLVIPSDAVTIEAMVLGPPSDTQLATQAALAALGELAMPMAICDDAPEPGAMSIADRFGDQPLSLLSGGFVPGPWGGSELAERVGALVLRTGVIVPGPGEWSLGGGPTPAADAVRQALADDPRPVMLMYQRVADLAAEIEARWCAAGRCPLVREVPGGNSPFSEELEAELDTHPGLVLFATPTFGQIGTLNRRLSIRMLAGRPVPSVVLLDGGLNALTYALADPRLSPEDRQRLRCRLRPVAHRRRGELADAVLNTTAEFVPDLLTEFFVKEARLYDSVVLGGLARYAAAQGGLGADGAALDAALATLTRAAPDAPRVTLDAAGVAEARALLADGPRPIAVVGASAESALDPETRRPRVGPHWLGRIEANDGPDADQAPYQVELELLVDEAGAAQPAGVERLLEGCP